MEKKMIATIVPAVLGPLVKKLTNDFLNRRRNMVTISELQDQVVRLMASHRELQFEVAQAQMTVIALTRYLAMTQGQAFVFNGDRLELAIGPQGQRETLIGHALSDFNSSVETHVRRQLNSAARTAQQPAPPAYSPSSRSIPTEGSASGAQALSSKALDAFFEGYAAEVMQARLGREDPT
jgi:hypothetical protein